MLKFCTRVSGSGWTTVWVKVGTPVVNRGRSAVSKEGSTAARRLVGVPGGKFANGWKELSPAGRGFGMGAKFRVGSGRIP
jgi:hypothetical protein